jgi:hypothetical protein
MEESYGTFLARSRVGDGRFLSYVVCEHFAVRIPSVLEQLSYSRDPLSACFEFEALARSEFSSESPFLM